MDGGLDILHPLTSLDWRNCCVPPFAINHDAQAIYLKDKVYVGGSYYNVSIGSRDAARLYIYTPATDTWVTLDTPVYNFALTTYRSKLVLVGGIEYVGENVDGIPSNKLWTLSEDGGHLKQTLPPMETACLNSSAVNNGGHLLVIDGDNNEVQVYNGHYWAKAECLPEHLGIIRSTICKGNLYVVGGPILEEKMKVFYTSLDSLIDSCLPSETSKPSTVWKRLPDVPSRDCYPVVFGNRLIAIGLAAIYAFSSSNQSWVNVGSPPSSFVVLSAVTLPSNELLVIGDMKVFRVTLKMTPFDPDRPFNMTALSLVEAAGIPLLSSLDKYTVHIKSSLGIFLPLVTPEMLFSVWLQGGVEISPTWRNLLQIIRQLHLDDLANQIKTYFKKVSVKHSNIGKGKTVNKGDGDVESQLRSQNGVILELKKEMVTLTESNKELVSEVKQLKRLQDPVKKEGGEGQLNSLDEVITQLKQGMSTLSEMTEELRSENMQLKKQLSHALAPIKEEGEEKQHALVPIKTEVEEETFTVTKEDPTSAQTAASWDLCGVEVCGEMTVVVHSSGSQQITWEGFGLKLHIDDGSLPSGIEQCTITIKASFAGQYEFPDNSYLVSAIFWLRCEPMCKFTKPVTVEMQHCAKSDAANLNLKFVRAVCSQNQLPYTFKQLVGDFTRNSSYGVIKVNGFSGLAVTQEGSDDRSYLANLLYKEIKGHPARCIVEIYIVVTWNMASHHTVMINRFKDAQLETNQPIEFKSDHIEFKVSTSSDGHWGIKIVNSSVCMACTAHSKETCTSKGST